MSALTTRPESHSPLVSQGTSRQQKAIGLQQVDRVARHSWLLVLTCLLVGLCSGLLVTHFSQKVYATKVQLFVATPVATTAELQQGDLFSQARVQSYTAVVNSPDVVGRVIRTLGLRIAPAQLSAEISAIAPPDRTLLNIEVVNEDPAMAARIANAVAAELPLAINQIEAARPGGLGAVKMTVTHPAVVPTVPIAPHVKKNLAIGLIAGLLASTAILALQLMLDDSIRTETDLAKTGIPVLAVIRPKMANGRLARSGSYRDEYGSGPAESFRQLRTNIQFLDIDNHPTVFTVTSDLPGCGKSAIALNLAVALAAGGFRVCLVEADLRLPQLAKSLRLRSTKGLTDVLTGTAPLAETIQPVSEELFFLDSGPAFANPANLLASGRMRQLVKDLAAQFDYVVMSAAPLLASPDGVTVTTLTDATVLVVRSGHTTDLDLKRALDSVMNVGRRVTGLVLTT